MVGLEVVARGDFRPSQIALTKAFIEIGSLRKCCSIQYILKIIKIIQAEKSTQKYNEVAWLTSS